MTRARNRLQVFRFRHPEMESTFSQEIFPVKRSLPGLLLLSAYGEQKNGYDGPASRGLGKKAAGFACWSRAILCERGGFEPPALGRGSLQTVRRDLVTVAFQDGSQRTFSLAATLGLGHLHRKIKTPEKAFQSGGKRIWTEGPFALTLINLQKAATCAWLLHYQGASVRLRRALPLAKTRKSGRDHFFEMLKRLKRRFLFCYDGCHGIHPLEETGVTGREEVPGS